jgi:hypothetical protein
LTTGTSNSNAGTKAAVGAKLRLSMQPEPVITFAQVKALPEALQPAGSVDRSADKAVAVWPLSVINVIATLV